MTRTVLKRAVFMLFLCMVLTGSGWSKNASAGLFDVSREEHGAFPFTLLMSGSVRADYFRSSRNVDDETDFFGATAQVRLIPVLSDKIDGKVEARFVNPDIHGDRISSTASLQECSVAVYLNRVDVRIGKQNVAWGRADAANPTDNLTPRDYTILLPFDEDQRFGTTSVKMAAHVTPEYTVIMFMTPLFEPSKIPLPFSPGVVVRKADSPAHTLSNSERGLKLDKIGGETDWSVSYYHGFSLLPEVRSVGPMPSGLLLELRSPEMDVFGADVASNYGRYGFRAEAAYFAIEDYSRREASWVQPYLSYVFGVDRTFSENVNINMQIIGKWVPRYKDPGSLPDPVDRAVATENAVLFGQRHRKNFGTTLRIGDRWLNETLEAEIFLMAYFHPLNTYLRPLVAYGFTDRIKGSIGAELYSGAQESYFGSIRKNQGFFFEIRYAF